MASSTQCVNKNIVITKVPWGYKDACLTQLDVGVYIVSEKKMEIQSEEGHTIQGRTELQT